MIENEKLFAIGCLKSPLDVRDYHLAKNAVSTEFPETFELTMNSVKNQGPVSSCVGHGVASAAEYFNLVQNNEKAPLSAGFIYGYRYEYKGEGMYIRDALKTLQKVGIPYQCDFPYNEEVPSIIDKVKKATEDADFMDEAYQNRCSTYFRVTTVNEIKTSLMNYGPVIINAKWFDDNSVDPNTDIMKVGKIYSGYHCLTIYGWNKDGWLVQNSWGSFWAKDGRFTMPFDYPVSEYWAITDDIIRGIDDKDLDKTVSIWDKVRQFFYNIYAAYKQLFNKIFKK